MPCCAAINCSFKPGKLKNENEEPVSFHKFPLKNPDLLKKWLVNLRRDQFIPSKSSVVCSRHFEEKHLYRFGLNVTLRENAIPTKFDFPSHLLKDTPKRKPPTERLCVPLEERSSFQLEEHSYTQPEESSASLKRAHEEEVGVLKKKLKTSLQKARRLKRKVESLEDIVDNLKDKRLISDSCAELLDNSFTGVPLEVTKRILSKTKGININSTNAYPDEIRSFAMTLQYYSAKAYDYVRKTFDLALPHPDHIRRWYSKIPADPGFTEPSFKALKAKSEDAKKNGSDVVCSLMIDEMSIRRHVQWDGHRYRGYVDIGTTSIDDYSAPLARDALVFMVVAVNGNWKVPCGYFLTDGLSGTEKANLIKECLRKLHTAGIYTVSLTCDGPTSHISMFEALGATPNLPEPLTSFPHPSNDQQNVYVLLDICHMLKLVRNTLASGGIIKDSNGGLIKWDYVVELDKLQNSEGLRLANKLRSSHVNWHQQKMKVSLAAQVISSSVADALEFCMKDLKLPQFSECMQTVQFFRIFDKLFDIFNSKNAYQRGLKSPLRTDNFSYWNQFLDTAFKYIQGLKTTTDIPITATRKKTGFIGFLIAIKSFKCIFDDLIRSGKLTYLLTYKFSQDHIELFFAAIRSAGGSNNNPTAQQFISAYRRLLVRSVEGGRGNCQKQDLTDVLFVGDSMKVGERDTSVSDIEIIRKYGMDPQEEWNDHDYAAEAPNIWKTGLSEFKEAAVGYISGYVVKMVKKKIVCLECISVLIDEECCSSSLVKFKDRGGLCKPSKDVIGICLNTEKCIDQILFCSNGKLPQDKGIIPAVITTVFRRSNLDQIFKGLHRHVTESTSDGNPDNHLYQLIKIIIESYASIKLHHLGKLKNEEECQVRYRKRLSKLILFKNQ